MEFGSFALEGREERGQVHQGGDRVDEVGTRARDALDGVHDGDDAAHGFLVAGVNGLAKRESHNEAGGVALEPALVVLGLTDEVADHADGFLFLERLVGCRGRGHGQVVDQFPAFTPLIGVGEEEGPQVVGDQLYRHGELLAARVEGAALAHEVVGDLLGGHDDMVTTGDGEFEDGTILISPCLELEPRVFRWYVEKISDNGFACVEDTWMSDKAGSLLRILRSEEKSRSMDRSIYH